MADGASSSATAEAAVRISPSLSVEEFLSAVARRAEALDADGGLLSADDVELLARVGFLTTPLPAAVGGRGWGTSADGATGALHALRRLGAASLSLGRIYEGHINAVRLILRNGTPAQHRVAATAAREGCLFGVWNTEAPDRPLRLENGVLRGGKVLCSGAGLVERAVVTAKLATDEHPQMVVVSLGRGTSRADTAAWTPLGMRASATGNMDFDGISVRSDMLLGAPGAYFHQPDFTAGAWRFAAVHLGGMEAIAEALRAHLKHTGRGENPHQASRLGAVLTSLETARLWVSGACAMAEAEYPDPHRTAAYVSLARGAVERAALDIIEAATRSVGLQALIRPHVLERVIRDLSTYLRQPGPDHALTSAAAIALDLPSGVGSLWHNGAID